MTNDNKPPSFGSSALIEPTTYEPRSGKNFMLQEALRHFPATTPMTVEVILRNCTSTITLKSNFDLKDNGHTVKFSKAREGMSARPSLFPLAARQHVPGLAELRFRGADGLVRTGDVHQ